MEKAFLWPCALCGEHHILLGSDPYSKTRREIGVVPEHCSVLNLPQFDTYSPQTKQEFLLLLHMRQGTSWHIDAALPKRPQRLIGMPVGLRPVGTLRELGIEISHGWVEGVTRQLFADLSRKAKELGTYDPYEGWQRYARIESDRPGEEILSLGEILGIGGILYGKAGEDDEMENELFLLTTCVPIITPKRIIAFNTDTWGFEEYTHGAELPYQREKELLWKLYAKCMPFIMKYASLHDFRNRIVPLMPAPVLETA